MEESLLGELATLEESHRAAAFCLSIKQRGITTRGQFEQWLVVQPRAKHEVYRAQLQTGSAFLAGRPAEDVAAVYERRRRALLYTDTNVLWALAVLEEREPRPIDARLLQFISEIATHISIAGGTASRKQRISKPIVSSRQGVYQPA